ncbi:uncharacterized protein EV422DRAFT_606474 [Fimicolochytrium jonesii]|uniref:uncharacterized protein n=1 Tax=Fimicolochytrium jonesii TaxID=1396493 RepID=UPI0022FEFEEC|nr:uncharacterized protein EV422DRAFT_606474 [Fimicolochytrium jonesii]KAI8817210.1 hypothetical protein EV422DRAFT_606474 [Fimicolochytrium jonesii]
MLKSNEILPYPRASCQGRRLLAIGAQIHISTAAISIALRADLGPLPLLDITSRIEVIGRYDESHYRVVAGREDDSTVSKYMIIDGGHRVKAASQLNAKFQDERKISTVGLPLAGSALYHWLLIKTLGFAHPAAGLCTPLGHAGMERVQLAISLNLTTQSTTPDTYADNLLMINRLMNIRMAELGKEPTLEILAADCRATGMKIAGPSLGHNRHVIKAGPRALKLICNMFAEEPKRFLPR